MIPNTFEAYALSGDLGPVRYFAGYVAAMKFKGVPSFENMAARAGAPADVTAGMWLGSLKYGDIDKVRLRSSVYYVPDILTSNYNDVAATFSVTNDFRVRVGGQFMVQDSNGLNLLTAFVDQFQNAAMTSITEYRLILNYELTWKGSRH